MIKRFNIGKGNEDLREICADFVKVKAGKALRLYKLNLFCDTRFAAAGMGPCVGLLQADFRHPHPPKKKQGRILGPPPAICTNKCT